MSAVGPDLDWDVVMTQDVVHIVLRASELGFSPWRVGIALRIAPMELAWICAHLNGQDARRQLLDRNIAGRELSIAGGVVDRQPVERVSGVRQL